MTVLQVSAVAHGPTLFVMVNLLSTMVGAQCAKLATIELKQHVGRWTCRDEQ